MLVKFGVDKDEVWHVVHCGYADDDDYEPESLAELQLALQLVYAFIEDKVAVYQLAREFGECVKWIIEKYSEEGW